LIITISVIIDSNYLFLSKAMAIEVSLRHGLRSRKKRPKTIGRYAIHWLSALLPGNLYSSQIHFTKKLRTYFDGVFSLSSFFQLYVSVNWLVRHVLMSRHFRHIFSVLLTLYSGTLKC
jgi:hypothetical protein